MLLTIDIGNSSIVLAAYNEGDAPVASWRLPTDRQGRPDEYQRAVCQHWQRSGFGARDFESAALCSVVAPLTELWSGMLAEMLESEPLVLHPRMNLGLTLDVRSPDKVGMDRLADAVAVWELSRSAAVAVDFGTATTFNVVDAAGRFRGGAIAPGLATAADSLAENAPALLRLNSASVESSLPSPGFELMPPSSAIGRDTNEALRSGLVLGYTGLVEGLLARIGHELETPVSVIATGGLGRIITPLTSSIDSYDPWLTQSGIRSLYRLNAGRGRQK